MLAAQSGTILTDLSHRGVIGVSGEDSQTFLQGQTTNDVRLAAGPRAVQQPVHAQRPDAGEFPAVAGRLTVIFCNCPPLCKPASRSG